jgi:Family of unknown function (DUF6159)
VFSRRALIARIAAPRRGARFVRSALRLVRDQPSIALVASLTVVELVVGFVLLEPVVLALMVSWVGPAAAGPLSTLATIVLCWIPVGLLDGYCDVIVLTMVRDRQQGRPATIRGGMRAANGRLRTLAGWSGVSVLGLVALAALRMVPGMRLLRLGGNLAWELATFFVMPVIAFEERGTPGTLRRSGELIRRQAKEAVAPAAGMFLACLPVFLPGLVLLYLAYFVPVLSRPPWAPFPPPDATLPTLAMVAMLPGAVLVGTSTLLLRYALYQRATAGEAPSAYWARDLDAAMPGYSSAALPTDQPM